MSDKQFFEKLTAENPYIPEPTPEEARFLERVQPGPEFHEVEVKAFALMEYRLRQDLAGLYKMMNIELAKFDYKINRCVLRCLDNEPAKVCFKKCQEGLASVSQYLAREASQLENSYQACLAKAGDSILPYQAKIKCMHELSQSLKHHNEQIRHELKFYQ